jgi:hypothetical protein
MPGGVRCLPGFFVSTRLPRPVDAKVSRRMGRFLIRGVISAGTASTRAQEEGGAAPLRSMF